MSRVFLNSEVLRLLARAALDKGLTAAGLAIGSTASKYKTANTLTYLINGIAFTSGHADINPDSDTAEKCTFLVSINPSGTFKTTQSAIVPAADADPDVPAVPAGESPVGDIVVETDASTKFTPATTNLSAAGITDTYRDLSWPDTGDDSLSF